MPTECLFGSVRVPSFGHIIGRDERAKARASVTGPALAHALSQTWPLPSQRSLEMASASQRSQCPRHILAYPTHAKRPGASTKRYISTYTDFRKTGRGGDSPEPGSECPRARAAPARSLARP